MKTRRYSLQDRRGATLVLIAVILLGTLGILALAIDLGMLITARSEAQRTADAAALAGASVWMDVEEPLNVVAEAESRAMALANANYVRTATVAPEEVTIEVIPDSMKVRVQVRRTGIATWFARLLGFNEAAVWAKAAANVELGGAARCFAPFAIPDLWDESNDEDPWWEWDDEAPWDFDPASDDRYKAWEEDCQDCTGYGSPIRNGFDPVTSEYVVNDFGRQIVLKVTDPNSEYTAEPGIFMPWRLPEDPAQESCGSGGTAGETGGAAFRTNICSCNRSQIELDTPYPVEPGNMVGPAFQGMRDLIRQDPTATWVQTGDGNGYVASNNADYQGENWINNPRIMRVAIMNPGEIQSPGMQTITFNNFAMVFLEEQGSNQDPIVARFIPYSAGDDVGPIQGSLVRILRLVE
jgi:hypothetical protein